VPLPVARRPLKQFRRARMLDCMIAIARRAACAAALLSTLFTAGAASAACPGDCDGSGVVDVSKLIKGVNIALGNLPVSQCTAFDINSDGMVAVNELIAAVNAALTGCPATPTPSQSSSTPTVTPTPTLDIAPIFPANYRDSFIEVRDCRLGIEHGGVMIRVLANSIAAEPYRKLQNPLPVGSIVVKEEYDIHAADCSDAAKIATWSAMAKQSQGFDPDDGDWKWQRVLAPSRHVSCNDKLCPGFVCITCHKVQECKVRDYMCTVDDTPRGTLQPVLENLPAALLSIAGTSPTDVYSVGSDPGDGRGPYVVHYDGTTWKRLDTGATGGLWWISVTPIDGDFYMAGDGGLILQYDPSSHRFTRHTTPDTSQLFGIWGTAASNLYAVGADASNNAVLWHFDGMNWTAQDLTAILPQDQGPTTLYKIWGRSASDIFAVGETGIVIHYDGGNWSRLDSGVSTTLFTVHGSGSVLDTVGGFFSNGVLLEQKADGSFQKRAPSGTPQLNGVFVPDSGNAVAVGVGLSVAARDSSGWTLINDGSNDVRDFHGTWVDSDDGIWAVGGDLSALNKGVLSYGGPQQVATGPVQ
jgi:hypothetical protein